MNRHATARRGLPALLTLLGSALLAPAWSAEEIAFTEAQVQALGIELARPVAAEAAAGPRYPARVVLPPDHERVISAGAGGMVEAVLVTEGQEVPAGGALLRLRSAELAALQSDYLQALEQAGLAGRRAERDRALYDEGIIPERRVQESRTALAEARARVQAARQALEAAGMSAQDIQALAQARQISGTRLLLAPFDAAVLEVMVGGGEQVEPTTALMRLGRGGALWLAVRVPVEAAAQLTSGAGVRVAGSSATGRLVFVGRRVDPVDQSVTAHVRLDGGLQGLRPGQLVEAVLLRPDNGKAWRLPAGAVLRRGDTDYVFVRSADGFRAEPVRLLAKEGGQAVVSGALGAGDRVAAKGVAAIKGAWLGIGGE